MLRHLLLTLTIAILVAACDQTADNRAIPAELTPQAREDHRKLDFDGADNFRDLGGYRTADNKTVKWGLVYRSDALSDLSDEDMKFIQRLGIAQIVDLRTGFEKEEDPDRIPSGVRYIERPVEVEGTAVKEIYEKISSGDLNDFDGRGLMIEGNRAFVRSFSEVFGPHLRSLADPANLPSLAHCTGGKDRAGFAAAVTLLALGVPEETVRRDFLLTNQYTANKIRMGIWMIRLGSFFQTDPEKVRPLLGVEPEYIEAALDTMKTDYGSIDNYLREALGVTDEIHVRLRENLLEG